MNLELNGYGTWSTMSVLEHPKLTVSYILDDELTVEWVEGVSTQMKNVVITLVGEYVRDPNVQPSIEQKLWLGSIRSPSQGNATEKEEQSNT